MKISYPEPPRAAYFWEKKQGQISDQKFQRLQFVRKTSMPISVESLAYISNVTAWVAPDLLKALAIPSDTTVRRPAADWQDLKPY